MQEEACWDRVMQEAHELVAVPPSQDGEGDSQAPALARDGYLGALQQAQDSTQRRVCLQVLPSGSWLVAGCYANRLRGNSQHRQAVQICIAAAQWPVHEAK